MKKRIPILVALALIVVIGVSIVGTSAYTGDVIESSWASVTPTMDGVIAAGEWDDATTFSFTGPDGPATGYVKNDDGWLYMAVAVPHALAAAPIQALYFDTGHDQVLTDGQEDVKTCMPQHHEDQHFDLETAGHWIADDVQHGSGSIDCVGSQCVSEFSIPLNSGDSQDIAVSPGDVLGLLVLYADMGTSSVCTWPDTTSPMEDVFDPTTWGELVLATPPTPTPTPTPCTPGDVNEDGMIDGRDLIRLKKMILGIE
jgi:hypothetical protein